MVSYEHIVIDDTPQIAVWSDGRGPHGVKLDMIDTEAVRSPRYIDMSPIANIWVSYTSPNGHPCKTPGQVSRDIDRNYRACSRAVGCTFGHIIDEHGLSHS